MRVIQYARTRRSLRDNGPARSRYLHEPPPLPYPDGWFALGLSREWPPGRVATRPFMGEDVVVYRTRGGLIRVTRPYCPHLGAHLGVGGTVRGEELVCPFHRFSYAPDGMCVSTPYGPPPRARLSLLHVREDHGIVWAWHHHAGEEPTWDMPRLPGYGDNHIPVTTAKSIDLASHPQDFYENGVDFGHFQPLHGARVDVPEDPWGEGEIFHLPMTITSRFPVIGLPLTQDITMQYVGLGAVHTHMDLSRFGFHATYFALTTPIGPWRMRLTEATGLVPLGPLARADRLTAHLLVKTLSRLMVDWLFGLALVDAHIWHHKTYRPHPALSSNDGPIGPYRKWAGQFYPPEHTTRRNTRDKDRGASA